MSVPTSEALRVVLVTSSAEDIQALGKGLAARRYDVIAVLVPMRIYELARCLVPHGVRCTTHPRELALMSVDAWIVSRPGGRLERCDPQRIWRTLARAA